MDKETLSNYGWIVICVMVLAVMLALAGPFGNFVADAVKSTTQGLFDVNQNALNSTNMITVEEQSFATASKDDSLTTVVRFGETYTGVHAQTGICEFTFYENGSAKMKSYIFHPQGGELVFSDELAPENSLLYNGTEILIAPSGELFATLSSDGSKLSFTVTVQTEENGVITESWQETVELTIQEESTLPIKVNELYTANNGGASIAFTEDGTAYWYNNYSLVWTWQYKIIGTQVVTPLIFDIIDNGNALKVYEDGAWQTFYLEPGKMDEIS